MSKMLLAEDKMLALKTATRLLIARLGTFEAAASVCRLQVSALQECASRNHPERMLPLDVILQLEECAGEPIVTGAMARLQGLAVARPEAVQVPAIGASVGAAVAQAGALASELLSAQADGRLDEGERASLLARAESVRNAAEATMASLAPVALRAVA
jgi:hypothetical protein